MPKIQRHQVAVIDASVNENSEILHFLTHSRYRPASAREIRQDAEVKFYTSVRMMPIAEAVNIFGKERFVGFKSPFVMTVSFRQHSIPPSVTSAFAVPIGTSQGFIFGITLDRMLYGGAIYGDIQPHQVDGSFDLSTAQINSRGRTVQLTGKFVPRPQVALQESQDLEYYLNHLQTLGEQYVIPAVDMSFETWEAIKRQQVINVSQQVAAYCYRVAKAFGLTYNAQRFDLFLEDLNDLHIHRGDELAAQKTTTVPDHIARMMKEIEEEQQLQNNAAARPDPFMPHTPGGHDDGQS